MADLAEHHPFCSGCNLSAGCTDWTLCAREFFPNLHPAEAICLTCEPGPCSMRAAVHDASDTSAQRTYRPKEAR